MKKLLFAALLALSVNTYANDALYNYAESTVNGTNRQSNMIDNDPAAIGLGQQQMNTKQSTRNNNDMRTMAQCQYEQAKKANGNKPVTSFNGSKYFEICKQILKRNY